MIRLRAGRRSFTIIAADGTRRQFSWLRLAPIVGFPFLFFAVLLLQSQPVVRNYTSKARRNPALIGSAAWTFGHVQRKTLENAFWALPEPLESDLPTLRLFVGNGSLNAMQEANAKGDPELGREPGGDRPYFRAYLHDAQGGIQKAKISLRGAGKWHHAPEKPSLRVRIRSEDIKDGFRYHELSRPEDALALKNWLPNELGRTLGLFSDLSEHVRVFVNNRYFGVYLRTRRPGESLALANGRMPGTFFKGDFRDDLWETLEGWRLEGEASEADLAQFQGLIDTLKLPPSPATLTRLGDLVDLDVYARWAALMIASCSVHTDFEHNHVYFLCSNQGRLEAVPWDVNGFGIHVTSDVPVDLILHPLMDRATRDPRWVHLRNQYLQQLLDGVCSPAQLDARIDAAVARMRKDLEADVNLSSFEYMNSGLEILPWSVLDIDPKREEIKAFARTRHAVLSAYLGDARVQVEPHPERPGASRVVVHGSAALEVRTRTGEIPETDGYRGAPGLLHPGMSEELFEYMGFSFERRFEGRYHGARPAPLVYLVEAPPGELTFTNAYTGAAVTPTPLGPAPLASRSVHPGDFAAPDTRDMVLGPGQIVLQQDLVTAVGQRLVIKAGTVIRLAGGVGIYSRGQTLIEGTEEAPVKLLPLSTEPWACLGISGAASAGTRLEYLRAWGGSSGSDGSVRFKGMISVYDCPTVILRNCEFGANVASDDAVNLGECDRVLVEDCTWQDARSDALDLDMCGGAVRRCRWIDSGNDGLDMMSCRLLIEDCTFVGSGDKGISVGEGTQALVRDVRIEGCHIGLEAKDACLAVVQRTQFVRNRVAVNAYQKKWLYPGGGQAVLEDCTLEGTQVVDLSIKRRSRVTLVRTEASSVDRIRGLRVAKALPERAQALADDLGNLRD